MRVVVGIRLGGDDDDVGVDAVGNKGLGPVQDPVIVLLHRGGAHAGEVGSGIGLGHGDRQDVLAADALGQEARTLLFIAETGEIGSHQATVQVGEPVTGTGVGRFLDDHLVEADIVVPGTAVLLIRPDHQEALFTGPAKGVAIHDAGLTPALHMWHNLGCEELAECLAEHLLFFGKLSGQHCMPPWNSWTDGSRGIPERQQYGEGLQGQQ